MTFCSACSEGHASLKRVPGQPEMNFASGSCWYTDDVELHPRTGCAYAGDWMVVATDGKKRWFWCEGCKRTWWLKNPKKHNSR
jgi:hypothetical protein